ncbi:MULTISPECIES: hypothetical protein [Protofrankia]|uniref:Uncharacterized protein n=1 Tax=Protofrankia coriariae TaxID=1562887 RepID=A0ABR5F3Y7_9ACTN|nr:MULTISPECIES: hypothetical protein [Protofrankia]KLL11404.1 hypothetical protein FrCorBMG51_11655 [Protofrankia coriariae]ONH34324.1 hypothetical protein BL254_16620 [Protofrankia sp. BMG5.30]
MARLSPGQETETTPLGADLRPFTDGDYIAVPDRIRPDDLAEPGPTGADVRTVDGVDRAALALRDAAGDEPHPLGAVLRPAPTEQQN